MSEPTNEDDGNNSQDSEIGGKFGLGMLETILGQMKCEFNKVQQDIKKDKDSNPSKEMVEELEDVKSVSSDVGTEGKEQVNSAKNDEMVKSDVEEECSSVVGLRLLEKSCEKADDVINAGEKASSNLETLVTKKEQNVCDESMNTEPSEEQCETSKQSKVGEEIWSPKIVTSATDEGIKKEMGKRSLRSQNVIKIPTEEPTGVKRSARRRSKDSPRESVLQSAMARKEKSFSNIINSDDKSSSSRTLKMVTGRSSRVSPADKSASKMVQGNKVNVTAKGKAPKSPRLLSQASQNTSAEGSQLSSRSVSNKVDHLPASSVESVSNSAKVKGVSECSPKTERTENKLSADSNVKLTTRSQTPSSGSYTYTKTGKRRYKPFRGLRYSFTSGTKKPKIVRRRERSWSENSRASSSLQDKIVTPTKSDTSVCEESVSVEESVTAELPEETTRLSSSSEIVGNILPGSLPELEISGVRSSSPVIAEACQSTTQKRKLQPDEEDDLDEDAKRSRQTELPSPSPAEDIPGPSKPESTAISTGAGTAALCLCQHKSKVFVAMGGDTYCQAFDSLDSRIIGCGGLVNPQDMRMWRPSATVPFLLLCDMHMNRFLRHNCCPGCGMFCTEGKFVQCSSHHLYHRNCEKRLNDKNVCPHCGIDSPSNNCILTLGAHKNPVFLPQQKTPKKISFSQDDIWKWFTCAWRCCSCNPLCLTSTTSNTNPDYPIRARGDK